jgi:site-specific DNA recombinase
VLAYVERPEFAVALTPRDLDDEAREALALAAQLESELERARALTGTVENGRLALSVADFAVISARLTEQIDAARARAQDATVPAVLKRYAGPGARKVWGASSLTERRALIREVVRVTVNPVGQGTRTPRPDRVTFDWKW